MVFDETPVLRESKSEMWLADAWIQSPDADGRVPIVIRGGTGEMQRWNLSDLRIPLFISQPIPSVVVPRGGHCITT